MGTHTISLFIIVNVFYACWQKDERLLSAHLYGLDDGGVLVRTGDL